MIIGVPFQLLLGNYYKFDVVNSPFLSCILDQCKENQSSLPRKVRWYIFMQFENSEEFKIGVVGKWKTADPPPPRPRFSGNAVKTAAALRAVTGPAANRSWTRLAASLLCGSAVHVNVGQPSFEALTRRDAAWSDPFLSNSCHRHTSSSLLAPLLPVPQSRSVLSKIHKLKVWALQEA